MGVVVTDAEPPNHFHTGSGNEDLNGLKKVTGVDCRELQSWGMLYFELAHVLLGDVGLLR